MTGQINIYKNIVSDIASGKQLLAVLIDPDKFFIENASRFIGKVNRSIATHIFVGGSTVDAHKTEKLVVEIKKHTPLPIVLFPGDVTQITDSADAILFLSLISGRNPDYLIDKHVQAVSRLKLTNLEVIPTGYLLIEGGKRTAVEYVTHTKPMVNSAIQLIVDTASAGQYLGMQLIYLEAGSGAETPLSNRTIAQVKKVLHVPLIVGGGIRNKKDLEKAYGSGADLVVIGTAFEDDESFFDALLA
ncbi:geranylgeranylglyceryl/heptaprenylglyceryl phosphate synthase [Mariniflexile ostreae]|uniref:Geranylgeranylglyceryl phosphate synthase n=1 Tax=Mariniflexile ostreae TaxID=1520892 RepID=A0ABV5F7H4_9FLAO